MRFILIMPEYRKAFDWQHPVQIDHDFIAHMLGTDEICPIELADDVDLWVKDHPAGKPFFLDGVDGELRGRGFVGGRSRLGDCKGLPLRYSLEWIVPKLHFPRPFAYRKAA